MNVSLRSPCGRSGFEAGHPPPAACCPCCLLVGPRVCLLSSSRSLNGKNAIAPAGPIRHGPSARETCLLSVSGVRETMCLGCLCASAASVPQLPLCLGHLSQRPVMPAVRTSTAPSASYGAADLHQNKTEGSEPSHVFCERQRANYMYVKFCVYKYRSGHLCIFIYVKNTILQHDTVIIKCDTYLQFIFHGP